jgi:hypothetical protein
VTVAPSNSNTLEIAAGDLVRDRAAILDAWAANFPDVSAADHARRLHWFYEQNPLGSGRMWLLRRQATGQVVGTAGLGPRRFVVNGTPVAAGLASDFSVLKEHRTALPALMLQRSVLTTLEQDLGLIYTFPNPKSLPIFKRLGYQEIGPLARWVKVLRSAPYLAKRRGLGWAAPLLGPAVDLVRRGLAPETWRSTGRWQLRPVEAFDERLDHLVARLGPDPAVRTERSAAFLHWRYRLDPLRSYERFALHAHGDDRLAGWCVGLLRADAEFRIIDLAAEAPGDVLDALLLLVLRAARARGARCAAIEGCNLDWLLPAMTRLGFQSRTPNATCVVMTGATKIDLSSWRLLLADEDYN